MDVTYLVTTGTGEMRGGVGGRDEASQGVPTFGHDNSMVGMGLHSLMVNMARQHVFILKHKKGKMEVKLQTDKHHDHEHLLRYEA